jgi:methyl-accepting chemotaxis protein
MGWYRDRRTATKLLLAFGLTSALMAAVGYLGLGGMAATEGRLRTLYERELVGLSEIKEAHVSMVKVARDTRGLMLQTDPAKMKPYADAVEKAYADLQQHFQAYRRTIVTAEEQARAAEVERLLPATNPMEILGLAMAGDTQAATAKQGQAREAAFKVNALLAELAANKERLGQQTFEGSEQAYVGARNVVITLLVVAVTLAMALGALVARMIARPLGKAADVLRAVAGGDFTRELDVTGRDEVGQLATSLNEAVRAIRQALTEVSAAAAQAATASQQLTAATDQLSSGAQEQASSLEETAASLEEITGAVKQSTENAQQANQLARSSRDTADRGGQVVSTAVEAMATINQASTGIAAIITTIDEIAFQTNLLALNAAVEAAREIKGLIQDSVGKIETGSDLVSRSGENLQEIVTSVKRVSDLVAEIAAASQEQSAGIDQVNKAVAQMDQVVQANAAQTEELSSTAQSLSGQAGRLQALVARFKLDDGPRPGRASVTPPAVVAKLAVPGTAPEVRTTRAPAKAARPAPAIARAPSGPAPATPDGFDEFLEATGGPSRPPVSPPRKDCAGEARARTAVTPPRSSTGLPPSHVLARLGEPAGARQLRGTMRPRRHFGPPGQRPAGVMVTSAT